MEEQQDRLAAIIGKNITTLRKMANMTQLELAEKLNYSDKSVSKWEQGNGIPDVRILTQLSDLFDVTLDDLVRDHVGEKIIPKSARRMRRIITTLCSVGLGWLVAVVCFVLIEISAPAVSDHWLAFLYAVPVSAVIVLVFSCVWRWRLARIISLSVLIWTALTCIFLTAYVCGYNFWPVYLIGVPLQVLALFFFLWWKKFHVVKG